MTLVAVVVLKQQLGDGTQHFNANATQFLHHGTPWGPKPKTRVEFVAVNSCSTPVSTRETVVGMVNNSERKGFSGDSHKSSQSFKNDEERQD